MQQKQSQEVVLFYNSLLSAERAGVEVLSGLLHEIEDNNLKIVLGRFMRDEGMNCQIFSTLIKCSGEEPEKKRGTLFGKLKDWKKSKLNLPCLSRDRSGLQSKSGRTVRYLFMVPEQCSWNPSRFSMRKTWII